MNTSTETKNNLISLKEIVDSNYNNNINHKIDIIIKDFSNKQNEKNLWKLNVNQIFILLKKLSQQNVVMDGMKILSLAFTKGDWPQNCQATKIIYEILLNEKTYWIKMWKINEDEFNKVLFDHLLAGIIRYPRNSLAIAICLFLIVKIFHEKHKAQNAFSRFTKILQMENILTIDIYKLNLKNIFENLLYGKHDVDIEEIIKTLDSINEALDDRNKLVIRFNIYWIIKKFLTSTLETKNEIHNIKIIDKDNSDLKDSFKLSLTKRFDPVCSWVNLNMQSENFKSFLLDLNDPFINLSLDLGSHNDSCIKFNLKELEDMTLINPREFKYWIEKWMEWNINTLTPLLESLHIKNL
jgi:hypothetical protein